MYRMLLRFVKVKMPFYAVRKGHKPGVYTTWAECQSQVNGFSNPRFKKFPTEEEAWSFVNDTGVSVSSAKKPSAVDSGKTVTSEDTATSCDQSSTSSSGLKPTKSKKRSAILLSSDEIPSKKSSSAPVAVFTDGCCFFNGKGNPVAGIGVYWGPGHPNNLAERVPGRQTNNRAEIYAALRAVQQAKADGHKEITIYTDSQFLVNCQTKWVKKWKTNEWKSSNGKEVINREELELLDAEEAGINVTYEYVKGHDDNEGNEQADKLAKLGAKKDLE